MRDNNTIRAQRPSYPPPKYPMWPRFRSQPCSVNTYPSSRNRRRQASADPTPTMTRTNPDGSRRRRPISNGSRNAGTIRGARGRFQTTDPTARPQGPADDEILLDERVGVPRRLPSPLDDGLFGDHTSGSTFVLMAICQRESLGEPTMPSQGASGTTNSLRFASTPSRRSASLLCSTSTRR